MISLIAQIDFNKLNVEIPQQVPGIKAQFLPFVNSKPAGIINLVIPYLFVIAGLILLFMLVSGGIGMMLGANNENAIKKASGQITNALLGFLLLFVSYWIVQIIEAVLGITIF